MKRLSPPEVATEFWSKFANEADKFPQFPAGPAIAMANFILTTSYLYPLLNMSWWANLTLGPDKSMVLKRTIESHKKANMPPKPIKMLQVYWILQQACHITPR